jgi:hypothetical protein
MKVLKDFTTRSHRFRAGDAITAAHDLAPHDPADLQKRGFIGDDAPKPSKPSKSKTD